MIASTRIIDADGVARSRTPKVFHSAAQGRAAHPGLWCHKHIRTPTGFHMIRCPIRAGYGVKPRWGLYVGCSFSQGAPFDKLRATPGLWGSTPSALVIASNAHHLRRRRCQFHTPQALHSEAQGRAAHPGLAANNIPRTPTGFHMVGCALRFRCETPLGFVCCGVRFPRVRPSTSSGRRLGFGVQRLWRWFRGEGASNTGAAIGGQSSGIEYRHGATKFAHLAQLFRSIEWRSES